MPVENTSKREPAHHLLGLMGGSDDYITGMEAAGQRQLVQSDLLPSEGPWDRLVALGAIQGEQVDGDELFCHVTIPAGWRKAGSDHDMWSYLVDERGIRKVAIFYKAAFYDRRAFWRFDNPGYTQASEVLYGTGKVKLPDQWALFDEDERGEFTKCVDKMIEDAAEYPDIYGQHLPRAEQLKALVGA